MLYRLSIFIIFTLKDKLSHLGKQLLWANNELFLLLLNYI